VGRKEPEPLLHSLDNVLRSRAGTEEEVCPACQEEEGVPLLSPPVGGYMLASVCVWAELAAFKAGPADSLLVMPL
jgi:hypothetical protein